MGLNKSEGTIPMHQYNVFIYWNEADEIFVATVPELVECTATGATHDQALQAVHQAVETWIDSAKNAGHPIPEPLGNPEQQGENKGRGARRQERNEQRRRKREQGRYQRRQSS